MCASKNEFTTIALDYRGTLVNSNSSLNMKDVLVFLLNQENIFCKSMIDDLWLEFVQTRSNLYSIHKELNLTSFINCFLNNSKYRLSITVSDENVLAAYKQTSDGKLYEGVLEALDKLRKLGYSLILTSNTIRPLESRMGSLRDMDLVSYFDDVFLSSEIGYRKPSEKFYRHILKKKNLVCDDLVFIGDSYEKDYIGPMKLGIKSILVSGEDISNTTTSVRSVEEFALKVERLEFEF